MDFTDKVILITGAGSGIGRATAIKAASWNATVVLSDINAAGLEKTRYECELASPPSAARNFLRVVDVSLSESCSSFIKSVIETYERIDHVFNCAGINPTPVATEEVSDGYWDKMVNTNLKGVFNITRACLPYMKSGSSFVNVSSVCGRYPFPEYAVYCATKYAVIGFSKSLALEVGPRGVRVNVIAPGTVVTPTNVSVRAGTEALDNAAQRVALRRAGTAEEIGNVVLFLFSDASRYMNGSVVDIDGGVGVSR